MGLVCAVLVATRLPESRGEPSSPDRLGVTLLAVGVLALTLGLAGVGSSGSPLPLGAGLLLLPWTLTPLVVAPLAGALSDRLGHRRVLAAGMLAQGLGLRTFALLAGTGTGYAPLAAALLIAGIGISTALPSSARSLLAPPPPPGSAAASLRPGSSAPPGSAVASGSSATFPPSFVRCLPPGCAPPTRPLPPAAAASHLRRCHD